MRAALLAELKAPFVVEEVELLDPTPGRVVVRTGATPFCSTDCINQRGELGKVPPTILGHASIGVVEAIAELEIEEWRRVIDTNLTGAFLGMKTVHPSMRRAGGGAIVNVSSMAAYIAVAPASAYTASKWGLRGLTKAAAIEFGPDRIRVNSLHPGMINTPMIEGASDEATQSARYPIPRFGTSEEVAATMLHIVCDATYSTGSEFCVDGGILAGISVGD